MKARRYLPYFTPVRSVAKWNQQFENRDVVQKGILAVPHTLQWFPIASLHKFLEGLLIGVTNIISIHMLLRIALIGILTNNIALTRALTLPCNSVSGFYARQ